jgi:RHS repeat-associated protein
MQGGPWRYWEWDLADIVTDLDGSDSLTYVDGIVFRVGASYDGLLVDDIVLSDGRCKRSYGLAPGVLNGGIFGCWTGPNVTADNGNRVRYFHYNDLGSVQAQTKADGSREGVWEPDFFGNYRWGYSGSPARPELGLTGKAWDAAANLYYFNARWYEPTRGNWESKERQRPRGQNLYLFCSANPSMLSDLDGYDAYVPLPPGTSRDAFCQEGDPCKGKRVTTNEGEEYKGGESCSGSCFEWVDEQGQHNSPDHGSSPSNPGEWDSAPGYGAGVIA